MRGGRGFGFSGGRKNDNGYSCSRENEFSSGFSAERSGGFSSGYGSRGSGFLSGSGENRGGRGGGFGAGVSLDDGDNFGAGGHVGGFSGGRGSSFSGSSYDNDSGGFANRNRGFRGSHTFSSDCIGCFRTTGNDFNSGRKESFGKFGTKYSEFSSVRGGRGTRGFGNNYNGSFERFGCRTNTEETSFGARDDFNGGFSSKGIA